MKKLIAVSFICTIGIIACTKKAVPSSSGTGSPAKTETNTTADDKIQAGTDPNKKDDASQPASASPITSMDMGKTLYMSKCGTCHALKNPGDYNSNQWDNILKTMVPRAKLSADESKQLQGYIKANAKI